MNKNLQLPACARYVSGIHAADTLYTLAISSSICQSGNITNNDFFNLLRAAGKILPDHPLPKAIQGISCFSIISEYKCGYICHMCPYAKRNKNQMETEESMLLSYALKGYKHFQYLRSAGLGSQAFSSLFLLNDHPGGKIVPTLPLLKLSYHYLECTAKSDTNFSSLPSLIAGALDQNNKGKLLPRNIQTIREYLAKLQKNGSALSEEKISNVLNTILHPVQEDTGTLADISLAVSGQKQLCNPPLSSVPLRPDNKKKECLTGLLNTSQPAESKQKQTIVDNKNTTQKMEFHTVLVKQPCKEASIKKTPDMDKEEESIYLPAVFSETEAEQIGYPFYHVSENNADLQLLEMFLQFNPILGAEIVEDAASGEQMLLLCASSQFYYIQADQEQALALLRLYFSKSSIRCQICLEPYKLYCFLEKNNIWYKNVYSLRTAYKLLSAARGREILKTPTQMVMELTSKTNKYGYSLYLFTMLQYVKMYEVLSSQPLLQTKEAQADFHRLSYIDSLLGISYELKDVAETTKPLFLLDEKRDYQFSYTSEMKMKEGIYSVTFSFSSEKPINSLVSNILYRIARKNLANIQGYRLLQFGHDSLTIATVSQYYEELCEIVANLATYLAEKQDLIPLIIKEDTRK